MVFGNHYKTEYIEYFNYLLSNIYFFSYIGTPFDFFCHSGIFVKTNKNNYYIIDYASNDGTFRDTTGDLRITLINNFKYVSLPKYDKWKEQEYRMIEIIGPLYRESSDKIKIINNNETWAKYEPTYNVINYKISLHNTYNIVKIFSFNKYNLFNLNCNIVNNNLMEYLTNLSDKPIHDSYTVAHFNNQLKKFILLLILFGLFFYIYYIYK